MRGPILCVFIAVLLLGCASAGRTERQSMMIITDTALVSVVISDNRDRAQLVDASLQEAARITRDHGYQYFIVLNAADASQTGKRIVATNRVHRDMVGDGLPGNGNLTSLSEVYGNPPPAGERVTYVRPGLDITIRMYRPGEIDPARDGVWSSDAVLAKAAQR